MVKLTLKSRTYAQIYKLMVKTWSMKQGVRIVNEYLNILKNWWQELDEYYSLTMDCSRGMVCLKRFVEKDHVH